MNAEEITVRLIAGCCLAAAAMVFSKPFKMIVNFFMNSVTGAALLFIGNCLLGRLGISVGINCFTVIFTGFLGIPGVVCLYVLQILL